jgi:hypothetical protein
MSFRDSCERDVGTGMAGARVSILEQHGIFRRTDA